ncbi:hypothetical protein [Kitasatospora paranensis]|uniref:DNA primase/polymerase bifunctional N-terminal domain-containing protein n=1 Tax=Kitasatospora paranensis TaxID=258053 RepID=A0ABW2G609_9ACTN
MRTALDWLTAAAPDPQACRDAWDDTQAALLPAGRLWDVLLVPGPLARPALAVLARMADHGPVLADRAADRLGFLVPPGTADHWTATGVRGAGTGTSIALPHPDGRSGTLCWLVPPDGSGRLVDPVRLELALHAAAASGAHPG